MFFHGAKIAIKRHSVKRPGGKMGRVPPVPPSRRLAQETLCYMHMLPLTTYVCHSVPLRRAWEGAGEGRYLNMYGFIVILAAPHGTAVLLF